MPDRSDGARVLWVTEESPDHTWGGGGIRQAYLLDAIAAACSVDLLVTGKVRDGLVVSAAASVTEVSAAERFWTEHRVGRRVLGLAITLGTRYPLHAYLSAPRRRALAQTIHQRGDRYDLVCVEHESLVPLLPRVRGERWMITLHALYSEIIRRELELARHPHQRWLWRRELRKANHLERRAMNFDRCVVCSEEDAAALARAGGGGRASIAVIPNGVDLKRLRPKPIPSEPRVLLPATFSYPPNADAAVWFCHEVWPLITRVVPDATLALAGRAPSPPVRHLDRLAGVSVEPDVPSMTPYFESARVVVVPVRIGAGTRLKALDAMAVARPIVGTTVGLEGLGIVDGEQAFVADAPEEFANAAIKLLRSDELAREMGASGRRHVETRFGWNRIGEQFRAAVVELMAQPPSTARAAPSSAA